MTQPTTLSAAALIALGKAVAQVYYSRTDFEQFVTGVIRISEVTDDLPFQTATKKFTASALVTKLTSNPERYGRALARLVEAVRTFDDFSHLDGQGLQDNARHAVEAFKRFLPPETPPSKAPPEKSAAEQQQAERLAAERRHAERLTALHRRFLNDLLPMMSHQARGLAFEPFLTELFSLFNLDPQGSFALVGEQIDGAFTLDATHYLLEAKWVQDPVSRATLDAFTAKVTRKLDNTLGLALAVNGFSIAGMDLYNQHSPKIILMDGRDLFAVLEGRIRLDTLLSEKKRHAAHTGNIFRTAADIIANR